MGITLLGDFDDRFESFFCLCQIIFQHATNIFFSNNIWVKNFTNCRFSLNDSIGIIPTSIYIYGDTRKY